MRSIIKAMNFTPISQIPDGSFYQDDNNTVRRIDFVKMREQCEGIILRAGQKNWIDEDFIWNWNAANIAGLQRGSYWFYDSRETPQRQAELWKTALAGDLPEWGLWIDLEESYGGTYQGESNWKKFAETTRMFFPSVKIGIYTGLGWWNAQQVTQTDYWASYPLWIANYTSDPKNVILPKPWITKGAVLWQYTSKGNGPQYGAESLNIDLNHTSQAFYDLFGGRPKPPPDAEVGMRYFDIKDTLNIRSSPAVILSPSNDIGDLQAGDKVEVSETVTVSPTDKWGKLFKITRGAVNVVLPASTCYVSLNTTNTVETFPAPVLDSITVTVIQDGVTKTYKITGNIVES